MKDNLIRCGQRNPVGSIDRKAGIIYGASLITSRREATGHGQYIDDDTVAQVVALAKEKEPIGLKVRFDHPQASSRAMGTHIGRWHNVRRDGLQARGDIHLADASAKSPEGDLREYTLSLAEEDPNAFATSIVFRRDEPWTPDSKNKGREGYPPEEDPYWLPHARVKLLHQCDVVDEGAANDGLFDQGGIFGRPDYWPEQIIKFLQEHSEIADFLITQSEQRKRTKVERKEDMTELKEALEKVETLEKELKDMTEQRDELGKTAKDLETQVETEREEALADGVEQERANIKRRLGLFKNDGEFVLEVLELSDEEAQKKYIEKLEGKIQKKTDEGGGGVDSASSAAGNEPPDAGDKKTPVEQYEEKLAEKIKELGGKRGEARKFMAHNHPKLHEAWVASQSPAPADKDD